MTARTGEIISFARSIRRNWGSDPVEIANRLGIHVLFRDGRSVSAHTVKMDSYPTIISITGCEDPVGRQVLCAHELGHALLHDAGVNRFEGSYKSIVNNIEYEANLFAVALLFDDEELNTPISEMSNYVLKSILDCNIRR